VTAQAALVEKCRLILGIASDEPVGGDALIGMLQRFRPDGTALFELFDDTPVGRALENRLRKLFEVAGDSARPGGGQDAYFVIRNPPQADPSDVSKWAIRWLESLRSLAEQTGAGAMAAMLQPTPEVRVLEGIAPKQIRADLETVPLYRLIKKEAAELTARLETQSPLPAMLGPAYYFAACDWALRDYLLWPAFGDVCDLEDPFGPYFDLWRHGAKLRTFGDGRIDVYLPHRND
jgi:hypothetical protein